MRKKIVEALLLIPATLVLLLSTLALTGCGDNDDTFSLSPTDTSVQIRDFFNSINALSDMRISGFFEDVDCKEATLIINNENQFRSAYTGAAQIPQVDFSKYTLIIGQIYQSASWILKKQKMVVDGKDATLFLYYETTNEAVVAVQTEIFYWGLYPKTDVQNVKLRIYYNGKEFSN